MKITIECENDFRIGWLFQHLGGKKENFPQFETPISKELFEDGFRMGEETGTEKHAAYLAELAMKYFKLSI